MSLSDLVQAHIALAETADPIVADFAAKMLELEASEKALRSAYVTAYSGQAQFPKAGQTAIASYMMTVSERIRAGEARSEMIMSVGALAASAWGNVA